MRRVVGQSIWHKMGQQKMAVWGGGGEVLPYISHIGMCRRKGRGFVPFRPEIRVTTTLRPLPPTPTGTPTGNLHKSVWQVELLILNLRYVIKWYGLKKECSINKLVSVLSWTKREILNTSFSLKRHWHGWIVPKVGCFFFLVVDK